jgi:hypothetical protein
LPHSKKTFSFELPAQKAGDYRIDFYSSVGKAKFIGANWIFLSPLTKNFSVTGNKSEDKVRIYREITQFNNIIGPVGFPVEAGSEVNGKVYVYNPSSKQKTGLEVGLRVCEWGSPFCKNETEQRFPLPAINANEVRSTAVSVIAPNIPSAYEINITIYNKNEIESIYKNRLIVEGGTAKVRKIMVDGLASENYSFEVLISSSPDHFNMPEFDEFSLKMKLTNQGDLVDEQETIISKIIFDEIQKHSFNPKVSAFDKACFSVEKNSLKYDEVCIDVPIKEIQADYYVENPKTINVVWDYEKSSKNLKITLTKDSLMDARVRLGLDQTTIYVEDIKGVSSFEKNLTQDMENLVLIVDDFDAKIQQVIHINLRVDEKLADQPILNERPSDSYEICPGIVCLEGSVCDSQPLLVNNQACCLTKCIEDNESSKENEILGIPLIVWIALILVIIAAYIASSALKRVMKK